MPHPAKRKEGNRALALSARLLTVFRFVALPGFLWMMAAAAGGRSSGAPLVVLYLAVALSDFFDGRLARAAGAAEPRWAILDVAADVTFNLASLACAAWLGLVGLWVPAGVAVLAGRFVARNLTLPAPSGDTLAEDRAGKLAGVIYYALVGIVVGELAAGVPGRRAVSLAGDLTFLYTLLVLGTSLRRPPKSSA